MSVEQIIDQLSKTLLGRQNMVQAGKYLAEGFMSSGANTGFRSSATGVAGSRGAADDVAGLILPDSVKKAQKEQVRTLEAESRIRKVVNSRYAENSVLVKNLSDTFKNMSPTMKGFREDMETASGVLTSSLDDLADSFKTYEEEVKFWKKVEKKTGHDMMALNKRREELLEKLNSADGNSVEVKEELMEVEQQRTQNLKEGNKIVERGSVLWGKFFSRAGMIASFGLLADGARRFGEDIKAQLRFGTLGSVMDQQKLAIALGGVDPAALSEMSAQSRMATIAMGGQAEMAAALKARQQELFKVTGDFTESARFQTQMYDQLGRAGIRPALDEFDAATSTFQYLHRMTGMTTDQFSAMYGQLIQNSDIRQRLQSLDEEDRRQAMMGINARIQERVAMGMTTEQAIAASEALHKMTGEGPMARFKRAAQIQMAASALGIAGGAEAAQAYRLGDRATDAQRETLERVTTAIANARVESRQGPLGLEFMAERVTRGIDDVVGKDSPLITTLTGAFKPDGELLGTFKTTAESTSKLDQTLINTTRILEQILNILRVSALGGVVSGAAGVLGGPLGRVLARTGRSGVAKAGKGAMKALARVPGANTQVGKAVLGRLGTSVGSAGLGAAAGGVLAAGSLGYGLGTLGYKAIDDTSVGIGLSNIVGKSVDSVLSLFGVDAAEERLRMLKEQERQREEAAQAARQALQPASETAQSTKMLSESAARQEEYMKMMVELQAQGLTEQQARTRLQQMGMNSQSARMYN